MKISAVLKTIIGVPAAIWVTVKMQLSWEMVAATFSSVGYILSRLFLFLIPALVIQLAQRTIATFKKKR